jgi:hypothetical protein
MSKTWKDRNDLERDFARMGVGAFARRARAENLLAFMVGDYSKVVDLPTAEQDALSMARWITREGQ